MYPSYGERGNIPIFLLKMNDVSVYHMLQLASQLQRAGAQRSTQELHVQVMNFTGAPLGLNSVALNGRCLTLFLWPAVAYGADLDQHRRQVVSVVLS